MLLDYETTALLGGVAFVTLLGFLALATTNVH